MSDGIFAVAMTLLVLDLHVPTAAEVHGEGELFRALAGMGPQWLTYGMSFLILGIFWAGQQTQLNHMDQGTRDLTWIHLGFLFSITLMPLSTRLLSVITYRLALGIYWLNIFVPGAMLYWSWSYATRAGLTKSDTPEAVRGSICRRILIAQALRGGRGALLAESLDQHCGDRPHPAELCRGAAAQPRKALEPGPSGERLLAPRVSWRVARGMTTLESRSILDSLLETEDHASKDGGSARRPVGRRRQGQNCGCAQ